MDTVDSSAFQIHLRSVNLRSVPVKKTLSLLSTFKTHATNSNASDLCVLLNSVQHSPAENKSLLLYFYYVCIYNTEILNCFQYNLISKFAYSIDLFKLISFAILYVSFESLSSFFNAFSTRICLRCPFQIDMKSNRFNILILILKCF